MMCSCNSQLTIWSAPWFCEWKIVQSPALGMIEIIRDDCYDNISNSFISKYVEEKNSFL